MNITKINLTKGLLMVAMGVLFTFPAIPVIALGVWKLATL